MSDEQPGSLIIAGGGGHARVVYESARSQGYAVRGFLDDRTTAPLAELTTWLGHLDEWQQKRNGAALFPAVGDARLRRKLMDAWAEDTCPVATVCHQSAIIGSDVDLASGILVGPGAIINPGSRIGAGVIINTGAIIEHDARIGAFAHVAPGVVLGGHVEIGADCLIGLGCRILPGVTIGDGAVVGAGAIVTRPVPPHEVVMGVH